MRSRRLKKSRKAGERKSGRDRLVRLLLLCLAISLGALQLGVTTTAKGISTVGDYAARLNQAEQTIDDVIEQESPAAALVERMNAVKRLLPANEEIELDGVLVRVDNSWLHEAIDNVTRDADGDIEQRHSMLSEIADRLTILQHRVNEAQKQNASAMQDKRERLENILARPEYQPEEKRESIIQKWFGKLIELIWRLLALLFGGSRPLTASSGTITAVRILIVLLTAAALMFGAIKLARRLQGRGKPEKEMEARQVLGEEIEENVTAADLLAKAMELARQGEHRAAIRRAYIALLCDLEQRDKLRLHRSKTNRDYLDALRPEQRIYPSFSVMTDAFEHVWYGEERATEEEFKDFVSLYRETAG